MIEQLLTTKEAARFLGVSAAFLERGLREVVWVILCHFTGVAACKSVS